MNNFIVLTAIVAMSATTHTWALEATAHEGQESANTNLAVEIKSNAYEAAVNAVLTDQDSEIKNINNCSKRRKMWDGTQCVTPEYKLFDPEIVETSENTTYDAGPYPTNRHGCSSSKMNWYRSYKCHKPAGLDYRFAPDEGPKGTLYIHTIKCNKQEKWLGCL